MFHTLKFRHKDGRQLPLGILKDPRKHMGEVMPHTLGPRIGLVSQKVRPLSK